MDVLIIGAGGHGKVVLDILRASAGCTGAHRPLGFVDADPSLAGTSVCGLPVLGAMHQLSKIRQQIKSRGAIGAIVAIGDNRARLTNARLAIDDGLELINAIHPAAVVSGSATIGRNVVIAAGAIVCAEARIGDSAILNTGCIVDHECEIESGTHICPAAALAGRVRVEAGAFVGIGAKVIPCTTIGQHAIIGAGAVVIRDVPPGATAVGVPARIAKMASALAA